MSLLEIFIVTQIILILVTGKYQAFFAQNVGHDRKRAAIKYRITDEDKTALLKIARETITEFIKNKTTHEIDKTRLSPGLLTCEGAFVTLRNHTRLRGCMGNFKATKPLYYTVQSMAIAAASRDTRFEPIRVSEVKRLKIEISVLTPLKKIKSINQIELGKHGICIQKDGCAGTFLPKVATDNDWTINEFLGHCSRDKSGIGWDGWRDADIFIFEALVFGE